MYRYIEANFSTTLGTIQVLRNAFILEIVTLITMERAPS